MSKYLSALEFRNATPPSMCVPHPKEKFHLPGPVVVYVEDRSSTADPGAATSRVAGSYFDRLWHHGKQHVRCCLCLQKTGKGARVGAGVRGLVSTEPRVVQFRAQKVSAMAALEPMIDSTDAFNAHMKRQRQKHRLFGDKPKKRFKISHY